MFMAPFLLFPRVSIRHVNTKSTRLPSVYAFILGCWLGVFIQVFGVALIPSFGNVVNIFLLTFMMTTNHSAENTIM